jgi:septum site-determining protein MinC
MSTAQFAWPASSPSSPQIRIRGRSLMALVVTPEFPITDWFAALDEQLRASALLLSRPIVVDLSLVLPASAPDAAAILLEGLEARGLQLVAIEGATDAAVAGTRWEGLARAAPGGRPPRELADVGRLSAAPAPAAAADAAQPCLTIDQPVRSGQIVMFERGDIVIVGHVASGAEVIAGGSIHVYGTLRGRAIAGVRTGEAARIFCSRLEAELIGVGRHYRTAEDWGAGLRGRAVQAWCDRGALRLSVLD